MQIPILNDLVIILGLALVVIVVCDQLRVPPVVGFLLTGVLAGPHGLGLVNAVHDVETLAEIGVILLLFTIGLEFSAASLAEIKIPILVGGTAQVLLTLAGTTGLAILLGAPPGRAVFIGFLVALSSTAIVLKLLQDRAEVESPQGRTALGILIFQDMAVVPMMLIAPMLSGVAESPATFSFLPLLTAGAIVILVIVGARWVIPRTLYLAARLRDREVFLLSVVLVGLATAWLTSSIGLSLALGAFLAGIIIAGSEYSHRALGDILPFRDIFSSFFFVSIGMLFNLGFAVKHPLLIPLLALGVFLAKSAFAGLSTLFLGLPLRIAILTGLSLGQIGEFSFVLMRDGIGRGLLTADDYQVALGVSVLTMIATPFVIAAAPRWAALCSRRREAADLSDESDKSDKSARGDVGLLTSAATSSAATGPALSDHLVIIGFGLNGRNLAQAASLAAIPHVIIEMNPRTVRVEKQKGHPIFYGDAAHEAILHHVAVGTARVVVVAISDPAATRRIVSLIRALSPRATIIARTRFLAELAPLRQLGADEVIPEEFETSVEIFTRVLSKYLVPQNDISRLVEQVRADGYQMLRDRPRAAGTLSDLKAHVPDLEIATFRLAADSPVIGKSLGEIELRKRCGVHLVAIQRGGETVVNPGADERLLAGDLMIVLGTAEQISSAAMIWTAAA